MRVCDNKQTSIDSNESSGKRPIEKHSQATVNNNDTDNYCDTANAGDNDKSYSESIILSRASSSTEQQKPMDSTCDVNNDRRIANARIWIEDLDLTYAD